LITLLMISNSASFAQDNKSKSSNSTKQEKDIQPPSGEMWYEEGDEKLYKFDINPITPESGIKGGLLIYYGHYVKPPYKVTMNFKYNSDEKNLCHINVNGLSLFPGHRVHEKMLKIKSERAIGKLPPLSREIKQKMLNFKRAMSEIERFHNELVKEYDRKTKSNYEFITKKLENYLKNDQDVTEYSINSPLSFFVLITGDKFYNPLNAYSHFEKDHFYFMSKNEKSTYWEEDCIHIYNLVQEDLKKDIYFEPSLSRGWGDVKKLKNIEKILRNNMSREQKIKYLYKETKNINLAKYIYYNYKLLNKE
ncbi:MAG: hypothetical protein JW737_04250, partial [Acidobacteria bacterium]|nr:hypothetical protein [Acidobacteriota bacterium]